MKKNTMIIALIISVVMLSACADKNISEDSSSDSAVSSDNSSANSTETAEQFSEPSNADTSDAGLPTAEPSTETGPYGISATGLDGIEVAEEELSDIYAENSGAGYELVYAVGNGFTYLAEPTGICLNSRDNADIFNADELTFEGAPQNAPSEYKRYDIGDTICGLTLTDASTNFYYGGVDNCRAELEGSVTMTGYVTIAPEDEYGIDEGDVFFVPCPGSDLLPVVNFRYEGVGLVNPLYVAMSGDGFARMNEYSGDITLGNIHRTDLDLSGVPADYSYSVKATVTVDRVNLSCNGFSCYTVCNMTDFE
ncbi:MAG: hypothetical protein K2O14_14475, partial [Oscillospiraceae bacterium]|nr:hypothetical protein [Oscillospiraceae bacterium]